MASYDDDFYRKCADRLKNEEGLSIRKLSKELNIPKSTLSDGLKRIGYSKDDNNLMLKISKVQDPDLKDSLIRLAKQRQRSQDTIRVERKYFREKSRMVNALEEYVEDLKGIYSKHKLSKLTKKHPTKKGKQKVEGIVHLSDLHINEQVLLDNNKFDVNIASQRIQKHIDHAKKVFKAYGITDVLVAFTGDLMNSNRRADELLMNATNRANATFVAVDILQQAILDLNEDFNVRCASVTGNESRIEKDVGWINDLAQDNFDFMIYNTLAYLFQGSKGVSFEPPDDTYLEKVVNVCGQNILLIHGHNGFARDTDGKIASKFGQYAQKGIFLNYAIFGHIHSAHISDTFARSSGLPGSNNYSQNALSLTGKASQNIYIVGNNGDIHGLKVDLQDYEGYSGYNVKSLEIYDQYK